MIIHRLRQETREAHASLEKKIIPLLKQVTTVGDYLKVLELFHGYFKPLETLVLLHIDQSVIMDIDKRRKTDLLMFDMQHSGVQLQRSASTTDHLPEISNSYAALGAMYVMEGSTLGGAVISRMLRQRLEGEAISLRFFEGYGDESTAMWENFLEQLNSVSCSTEQEQAIVDGAKETFLRFTEWTVHYINQLNSLSAQRA